METFNHYIIFFYLDGSVPLILSGGVIDIGLLSRTYTAVYFRYESALEELEENHSGSGVHHLFSCRSVFLIPRLCS